MKASSPVSHADHVFGLASRAPADFSPGALSPTVDASWRRCLAEFHLDPVVRYDTCVIDASRLKDLQGEHDELIQIARAEMDALYEQIAGSGFALLLADTSGVILWEKVDPTLQRMFAGAGLVLGAEWSERREGTNGIGTCVREARPITIHQSEHFRSSHVNLSCSAAPIHDTQGNVIAVLDASCVGAQGSRESQLHTVALVQSSARLIEKCLFLRRHRGAALLRFHQRAEFIELFHDGAIALDTDGTILATDLAGLRLLGASDRSEVVGRSLGEVFDVRFEDLQPANASTRKAIWPLRDHLHGRRYYASFAEPQRVAVARDRVVAASSPIRVHRHEAPQSLSLEALAGEDPAMLRAVRNARRVADGSVAILIEGPTGCGKEAFAKAVHQGSRRVHQPFVAVNCGAIPESLIESELFGYGPGAFTGARRGGLRGRVAQSSGGTLFLDEIGDMPLALQTRLLRVLEEQELTPLGTEQTIKLDLRVMCASHRNLRAMIERGEFRADLYYRLSGIILELPALASRRDRESLLRTCIARELDGSHDSVAFERDAWDRMLSYEWPGNLREQRNAIRAAIALCDAGTIRLRDLPQAIGAAAGSPGRSTELPEAPVSLEGGERAVILRAIEQNRGNMSGVARQLKISRNTLYRKMKAHRIALSSAAR